MRDKQNLIEAFQAKREEIGQILEQLSDEAINQPETIERWSVKDVITHLNMWEAELIKTLHQARQGVQPDTLIFNENFDEINQGWFEAYKDRELPKVLDDFDGIERQICRMIEAMDPEMLFTPGYFLWLGNHSLSGLIEDICIHHEEHHLKDLRQWLSQKG